ncbi:sigma factor-like helix-turn-helix DNA-binding protein [Streptomyces hydrogenans]|uniref:sigma factor-like helix-turn-helix DNA-binding protein n=1 Tax=Streptomyces hydrogenans TaxID=1873719 RepID=UPI0035D98CCE
MTAGADGWWTLPDEQWTRTIRNISRNQASKFACGSDAFSLTEDIHQEILLKWLENHETIRQYIRDDNAGAIRTCLFRWAAEYGYADAVARGALQSLDQWGYSVWQIRELIPFVDDPASFNKLQLGGEREVHRAATKLVNQSGDSLATYADLRRGWDALTDDQRHLLALRHIHGLSWPDIAESMGIGEQAARQRAARAERHMQKAMGGRDNEHQEQTERVPADA